MSTDMKHITVFSDPSMYAGWPANHGAWQWSDELLVGFMCGPYERGGMHNIGEPYEKVQARSLDGGETWTIEKPNVDFSASVEGNRAPNFDLSRDIIRVCGVYDTGGEDCNPQGGFYLSQNKGQGWFGPYGFTGVEDIFSTDPNLINTSRTAVLGNNVFISVADRHHWGSDQTYQLYHDGMEFALMSKVCGDAFRAVMPAVTHIDKTMFCALRRKDRGGRCWIDLFASEDTGATWEYRSRVAETGGHNGNPPALLAVGHCLFCVYANRSAKTINVSKSFDFGQTWDAYVLRSGEEADIGYPRLFKRRDAQLVAVYYWSDAGEPQHIEATIFDSEEFT